MNEWINHIQPVWIAAAALLAGAAMTVWTLWSERGRR